MIKFITEKAEHVKLKISNVMDVMKIHNVTDTRKIILVGTPNTPNIGDHIITEGEIKFLHDYFPSYEVLEITGDMIRYAHKVLTKKISNNDLIIVTGGGFLGSLWMTEEEMVRKTLMLFPENKIMIFPQTIYFDSDEKGISEYKITKEIYMNHKKLWVCTRERKSYDFFINKMQGTYSKCLLIPDMATYLHFDDIQFNRKGILLCFRKDVESILSETTRKTLTNLLNKYNENITFVDTVIEKTIYSVRRDKYIKKLRETFCKSRLVITDRLHGMILCAITGTPCIAFNNKTDKVKGVFQWIKHLPYIICVDDDDLQNIDSYINNLLTGVSINTYDNNCLIKYFNQLSELIHELLEE